LKANMIMAEPRPLLSRKLAPCSIIRPTETEGIATGAVNFLTAMGLFIGHPSELFASGRNQQRRADKARREH
jgi:hypothetical protein